MDVGSLNRAAGTDLDQEINVEMMCFGPERAGHVVHVGEDPRRVDAPLGGLRTGRPTRVRPDLEQAGDLSPVEALLGKAEGLVRLWKSRRARKRLEEGERPGGRARYLRGRLARP